MEGKTQLPVYRVSGSVGCSTTVVAALGLRGNRVHTPGSVLRKTPSIVPA
jgi:hypothetical protein